MHRYAERLGERVQEKSSPVLLGMDPRFDLVPDDCFPHHRRDLDKAPEAYFVFARRIIDAVADHVAAIKLQIAFYENFGPKGLEAYQKTLAYASEKGLITIGDIKRGDIGSTAESYAQAHLGGPNAGPFEADAVTLNAWLGKDSLEPFFERCQSREKGVYLLLHTSNPGSKDLQEMKAEDGRFIYEHLADKIGEWQNSYDNNAAYSSIGVVVGATFPEQLTQLHQQLPRAPFLIPGYGAQGGKGKDLAFLYKNSLAPHLINASRSIIFAYKQRETTLEEGALAATIEMKRDILGSAWVKS